MIEMKIIDKILKKFHFKIAFFQSLILILMPLIAAGVYAVESTSPQIRVALLNQDPNPARAGDTLELRLIVENVGGGSVENVQVEALQEYPFTVIDAHALQNLGKLYGYQTDKNYFNIGYKLKVDKDAVNGEHEIKVRYTTDGINWVTSSFSIDIKSKEFAQIIYLDKAKIEPGKETEMKFTITNIGNAPLQNLIFSWSEPNGVILPVYSDDTKYIKYLDIGKSVDLKFTVIADVNAKPGLYKLDLILNSESLRNFTINTIKTRAGVFVGGETDFDVAFSESTQGQTSLSVANTGNTPALSVSVRIPEQNSFRVTGSNSAIIGNLDKGDYTIVSFQINQGGMGNATGARMRQSSQNSQNQNQNFAGRSNNLKVVIDYTDTTGERRSIEKNLPIQFRTSSAGSASGSQNGQFQRARQTAFWQSKAFYAPVIIAILVLGFIIYRKKGWRLGLMEAVKKK